MNTTNQKCHEYAAAARRQCAVWGRAGGRNMEDPGYIAMLADRIIALRTNEAREQMLAGGAL